MPPPAGRLFAPHNLLRQHDHSVSEEQWRMARRTPKHDCPEDSVMEFVQMLPDLAVTLYQAAPHGHHGLPIADGLAGRQMRAVVHLAHHGRMPIGEFADGLSIGRAAAGELIARLSEKGVVRRQHDDTDRRIVFVSLTGRAEDYADTMLAEWRENVEATLASFPEIDPATLVAFLRALALRWKIVAGA